MGKNVAFSAARLDTPDAAWPAESARNAARYVEFKVPVTTGAFTIDTISLDGGSGGGSNTRWDIVYSLALSGVKDTLVTSSNASLGVNVPAGQTLTLRVYPYNTAGATSGKTLMLANVVISGVTN